MLNLVSPTNNLLVKYKASMDRNPIGLLPKNITFKYIEDSSEDSQGTRMKSTAKPKAVKKEF